jgi:hypothetical protein
MIAPYVCRIFLFRITGRKILRRKKKRFVALQNSVFIGIFTPTLHEHVKQSIVIMFRKIRDMYRQYKPYVRVDLIMYASLILMIILYFIVSTVF